jgi:hypothetical protein
MDEPQPFEVIDFWRAADGVWSCRDKVPTCKTLAINVQKLTFFVRILDKIPVKYVSPVVSIAQVNIYFSATENQR